jgi:hypothetical protein
VRKNTTKPARTDAPAQEPPAEPEAWQTADPTRALAFVESIERADFRLDHVAATITHQEAEALAERLTHVELDGETVATILLLIAAATFEESPGEQVYHAALRVLSPYMPVAEHAAEAAQVAQLHRLRQKGARADG